MTTNACTVPSLPTVPTTRAASLPRRSPTRSAGLAEARSAVARAWGWLLHEVRQSAEIDARLRARREEDARLAHASGLLGRLY
ncbi:hypothetical protein [Sinomonas sp. G460-2]|uniref:hypothetical protein n=1 Tax=Sinomonas sp. G460-2 TaxID=3393464 RepID=UPI0039EFBE22